MLVFEFRRLGSSKWLHFVWVSEADREARPSSRGKQIGILGTCTSAIGGLIWWLYRIGVVTEAGQTLSDLADRIGRDHSWIAVLGLIAIVAGAIGLALKPRGRHSRTN